MERRPLESDRIVFPAMVFPARIGAFSGETDEPQPLRIRLEIELDLSGPAASDRLADTVDYGGVAREIEGLVTTGTSKLLESLAWKILRVATRPTAVIAARVAVEKIRPPLGEETGTVFVQMARAREELH